MKLDGLSLVSWTEPDKQIAEVSVMSRIDGDHMGHDLPVYGNVMEVPEYTNNLTFQTPHAKSCHPQDFPFPSNSQAASLTRNLVRSAWLLSEYRRP